METVVLHKIYQSMIDKTQDQTYPSIHLKYLSIHYSCSMINFIYIINLDCISDFIIYKLCKTKTQIKN